MNINSAFQESSWWMNLFQEGDSIKWLTSPEENPTFVDWEKQTDFYMDRSGGVITKTKSSTHWSLKDIFSKQGFICEMQDQQDSGDHTSVYIEDRNQDEFDDKVDLQCVPSGWFVSNSIIWLKDDVPISAEDLEQRLHMVLEEPFQMENVSEFQGYFYCSVALRNPSKRIFSPKVLVKYPGVHTFVLHMKSKIPENNKCSDINSLELPFIEELNRYLKEHYNNDSRHFLKDVTCTDSVISTFHHFYIYKDKGAEKELQNVLESSINSKNGTLFQTLKRHNMNKDDISFKSTVSCSKEMSNYNGYHLFWPETLIGESTLPNEMCITAEGSALERKCLGDFYRGAYWSPVEKDCADVKSELTMTLHKLAGVDITERNVLNSTLSIETLTKASENLSPADMQYVEQILANVAKVPVVEPGVLRSVVHTVDTTMDGISTLESKDILSNLNRKINRAVENIALNVQTNNQMFKLAGRKNAEYLLPLSLHPRGGVLEKWGSNLTMLFNDNNRDLEKWLDQFENFEAAVLLPENLHAKWRKSNKTNIFIAMRRYEQFLKNAEVISPVIDVVLSSKQVYDVDPPLKMFFKVKEMNLRDKKSKWGCASWDETLNNNSGGWSYKGCVTVLIGPTHVRCYCNHLTSFAVVSEKESGYQTPKSRRGAASNTAYIVCSLLLVGLGILVFLYLFRKRRSREIQVQSNLPLPVIDTNFTSHVD